MAIVSKTSRIDIRLSESDKSLIEKAAKLNRQSISSYIVSTIIKQARLDLVDNERILLSNEDRDILLNLLEKSNEPNEHLKKLLKNSD